MICDCHVTYEYPCCKRCRLHHDLRGSVREWPAWARQLAHDHARERQRQRLEARAATGNWPHNGTLDDAWQVIGEMVPLRNMEDD
jgi:hypothetical protein